jgi:hypothetical protein
MIALTNHQQGMCFLGIIRKVIEYPPNKVGEFEKTTWENVCIKQA